LETFDISPPISQSMHRILLTVGLALGTISRGVSGQAGASAAKLDTAAILASARPEIEAANAAWLPGLKQQNATAIVAPYADSGLFIQADGSVIRGRAAIAKMYVDRFPRMKGIRDGGIVQDGMAVVGPTLIYEWGHGWLELAPTTPGGPPVRSGGRYLTVWQRATDGHWHIIRNLTS
jgi:ketosteroid isomerase-like protein